MAFLKGDDSETFVVNKIQRCKICGEHAKYVIRKVHPEEEWNEQTIEYLCDIDGGCCKDFWESLGVESSIYFERKKL